MNHQNYLTLEAFLQEQIALCHSREEALRHDGREDEAVFQKIRSNIYDIFHTVLSAGVRVCEDDAAALGEFFRQRIQQIPQSWESAREKASAYGDSEKMHLEQLKLDTARQIRDKFESIWEVAQ